MHAAEGPAHEVEWWMTQCTCGQKFYGPTSYDARMKLDVHLHQHAEQSS